MAANLIPVVDTGNASILLTKGMKDQLSALNLIANLLTKNEKKQLEKLEELRKFAEREEAILNSTTYSGATKKAMLIRNKLTYEWQKVFKNKTFIKVLTSLKTVVGKLSSMAKNSFMKLLGFLMMMAIFDPKGTMLKSILGFLLKMAVSLIRVVAKLLPGLIKTMINLVTDVLPGILVSLISEIFPALGKIFKDLAKSLKDDFPILSWIIGLLGKAFDKDGALYKFAMALAGMLPVLLTGFMILGFIMKILPALKILLTLLKGVGVILKGIGVILKGVGTALWWLFGILFPAAKFALAAFFISMKVALISFLSAALPIIIIIAVIIAAIVLLWVYADQVAGFFEGLWQSFKKLGIVGKILVIVIALLLFPITAAIAGIYGLVKLFQFFKKHGFKEGAKIIWKGIKNLGKVIWGGLKSMGSWIWRNFTSLPSRIWSSLKDFGRSIWDKIKSSFMSVINWIKELFAGIGDYFSMMGHMGRKLIGSTSLQRSVVQEQVRHARSHGSSLPEVETFLRTGVGTQATKDVAAEFTRRGMIHDGREVRWGDINQQQLSSLKSATDLKLARLNDQDVNISGRGRSSG